MSLEYSPPSSSVADANAEAQQAEFVAFLHRVPFAIDALQLGYLPGFREDCTYQQSQFSRLKLPVGMLDNYFRNPDLDRYVERFFDYEPRVGIVGDAYSTDEAREYVAAVRELQASFPDREFVIVPKCQAAIDAIPQDIVLGYSRGYADRLATDFSDPADWRGRRIHVLGGSPRKQLAVIDTLTRPTLTDAPPADIVSLDWNGLHRGAQFGEFWTPSGWDDCARDADHITIRKTVRQSLGRLRKFWKAHGIWPETSPQERGLSIEYHGPSPSDLETAVCAECGENVWTTERGPYIAEYDTGAVCGYCSYECYFTHRHTNRLEELAGEQSVYFPPE